MDWNAIGALAEVLAAIAVIGSVVYLALQIRTEAAARRGETLHAQAARIGEIQIQIAASEQLTDVFVRGIENYNGLARNEAAQFAATMGPIVRTLEENYFQWQEGNLDPRVWEGIVGLTNHFASSPGVKEWWLTRAHWYSAEFGDFFEQAGKATTSAWYPRHET
jgi:hypothetical protein